MTVSETRTLIVGYIELAKIDNGTRTPGHPTDVFAAEFLELHARHGKPSTVESDIYMLGEYILPAFGHVTMDAVSLEQVRGWFACLADQPGIASRALPVLSVMMLMAEPWRYHAQKHRPPPEHETLPG